MRFRSLLVLFVLSACSSVLYNVQPVTNIICATTEDNLRLQVRNTGKKRFSNLQLFLKDTTINVGSVEPGKVTCAFEVPPMYANPGFSLYVLKSNRRSLSITSKPFDHIGETRFVDGVLELAVHVSGKDVDINVTKVR